MPSYHEANEVPYQGSPAILMSANRQPQFNQTTIGCGCQCGNRGEDSDGGSNEDDNASTLVASNFDSDEEFPSSADGPEQHVNAGAFREDTRGSNEDPRMRPRAQPLRGEMVDSMRTEFDSSDEHSVVASDTRSVSRISVGPGIGDWTNEDFHFNELHWNEYYFVVRPLRLTPQRRYCRGLVASHMVVRDEDSYDRGA